MLGSAIPRLITAANGAPNVRIASDFRRLQTARASSTPAPFRAACSGIAQRLFSSDRLRHQDDVAVLEVEVFVLATSRDHLVVVERDPRHGLAIGAQGDEARASGELVEPPGQGEYVQHRGPALELVARGLGDLPDD